MIIDSAMTLSEALAGSKAPAEILAAQTLIDVDYISFDKELHRGQLVIHQKVAPSLKMIFGKLLRVKFPIEKMIPIVKYGWSDEASMADNNSSGFNYRLIYGTQNLSNHSYGQAIDINTRQNPYIAIDGKIFPEGAIYDPSVPGTLVKGDRVVSLFESMGWEWGGKGVAVGKLELTDWQHFQKTKFDIE